MIEIIINITEVFLNMIKFVINITGSVPKNNAFIPHMTKLSQI